MSSSHLVRMQALKERTRRALTDNIDRMRGPKALVIDPTLSGPLGLIAEKQLLKDHGVEKTYHLRSEPLETDQRRIMYLVREKMTNMKLIAEHIKQHVAQRQKLEYFVCIVPRKTIVCERVLEEEGVYGEVQLGEFDLDLIPFEDDLLSMEMPDGFRESVVDGDPSVLYYAARSLLKLESLFGRIPKIKGKGNGAKAVADMLLRLQRETASSYDTAQESEIDELILLDREVDLVTPMMTQLTYEGLIDDIFGINHGIVELPANIIASAQSAARPNSASGHGDRRVKVQFNGSDQLFAQLRDVNFEEVGPIVKQRATLLKSVQDEKKELQEKSVKEIREYVKKLKELNMEQEKNLLSLHTSIALEIKGVVSDSCFTRRLELEQDIIQGRVSADKALDQIEELIYVCEPLGRVMRLLCLTSLVFNGLKRFDSIRQLLYLVYGFEVALSLPNLDKAGLLKRAEPTAGLSVGMLTGPSSILGGGGSVAAAGMSVAANLSNLTSLAGGGGWEAVRKRLKCVVDMEEQGGAPSDVSYVYSGYAPVSLRVLERALRPGNAGWMGHEESLKILPGALFESAPDPPPPPPNAILPPQLPPHRRPCKVVLVFFIYGVTVAEVSAVRLLGRVQSDGARGSRLECIVATTKLASGEALISSLLQRLPPPPTSNPPPTLPRAHAAPLVRR